MAKKLPGFKKGTAAMNLALTTCRACSISGFCILDQSLTIDFVIFDDYYLFNLKLIMKNRQEIYHG